MVEESTGRLCGLVMLADVFRHGDWVNDHWECSNAAEDGLCACDIAQTPELIAHQDDDLTWVLAKQAGSHQRVVVVVDGKSRPVGIITQQDGVMLAHHLLEAETTSGGGAADPTLGRGRYELLGVVGRGGMAVVYRAWDNRLQVERAVKVLKPEMLCRQHVLRRFQQEAQTVARLHHPHIVTVHDVQVDEGQAFIVMELLDRGSLADWCRAHGTMPPRMAAEAMLAVLDGLVHAHSHGVVHRDVKPRNVLLGEAGEPKLADFGIAQVSKRGGEVNTGTGVGLGTEAYMAPEQRVNAKTIDERADLYAAGATLYALLSNEPPSDLFIPQRRERMLVGVPPPLARVIQKATRYQPDHRYESAAEMLQALAEAMPHLPAVPDGVPPLGVPVVFDSGNAEDGQEETWSYAQARASYRSRVSGAPRVLEEQAAEIVMHGLVIGAAVVSAVVLLLGKFWSMQ